MLDVKALLKRIIKILKILSYTGEYIKLQTNQDASTTAGQVTCTTSSSYRQCIPANKYGIEKSSALVDDIMTASSASGDGSVTIKRDGKYRIDFQVYLYSGYTANDQITAGALVNGSHAAERSTRTRVYIANPYTLLVGSCTVSLSAGNVITLGVTNQQGARGTIGLSKYNRMTVECLDVYE